MAFGFRHSESVLIIYVIQTVFLLAAVIFRFYSDWLLLSGYLLFSTCVLIGFSFAARTERKVKRFDFLDLKISGRLRLLKREGTIIRPSFRLFEFGIPLLLFITCLIAAKPSMLISMTCALMAALILLTWYFRKGKLGVSLRFVLYILIPFAVYLSNGKLSGMMIDPLARCYNLSFGIFAVLITLISKFSRREKGFHSSPMDFLIIILALVVPNMADEKLQEYQLGLMAAKIILLYFSYEVLLAELRGKFNRVALATVASLLLLTIK
jgi:UDP-GlcNAc:undecaprenyl-phosphate GlcNAc-1-phosphate transferase